VNKILLQYYLIVKTIFHLEYQSPVDHIVTVKLFRITLSLSRFLVNRIAALFHVPDAAVEMLRSAASISAVEKKSLPTELLSLNAVQFSRGLLNFSFFQSNLRWIFPYWAVRQYDPEDPSFIPRAHLGFSMNLTHRNWTAVGTPDCSTEPIVDPRGLVTPFRDSWSIDTWIEVDGTIYFPSQGPARQCLQGHYPIVVTEITADSLMMRLTTFVDHSTLLHSACVINTGAVDVSASVHVALRPFNPEGVGLITSLAYADGERSVLVNMKDTVYFSEAPAVKCCSAYGSGDSAWKAGGTGIDASSSECEAGFANGFFSFPLTVPTGDEREIEARVPLDDAPNTDHIRFSESRLAHLRSVTTYWDELLHRGAAIETPDAGLTSLVNSSLVTLLLLTDGSTITPGPAAYHHFWFRDAAFMIHALDTFGHHAHTRPIIDNFFSHQEANGYFRSQKGEWDSNGQAVWAVHEHTMLTGSDDCVTKNFQSLLKAVEWIDRQREKGVLDSGRQQYGLMPAGLSAEHLGLADHYYWDNFWSLAGVRAFTSLCSFTSASDDQQYAQRVFDEYAADVERSLAADAARLGTVAMTAAPGREIDCGSIGSLSALYPLQLFELGRDRLEATVREIAIRYCRDELFFQHFIHSGMNIYLSLHVAHACLLLGDRKKFGLILSSVARHASPTGTFPEAIHPATGGGSMGDGHHGWAAAEVVLAVRAMFILETAHEVRFLSGTPEEWYREGQKFSIRHAPTHSGLAGIAVENTASGAQIILDWEPHEFSHHTHWLVMLPYASRSVTVDGAEHPFTITHGGDTSILLAPGPCTIIAKR
jgi:hypothetical protein